MVLLDYAKMQQYPTRFRKNAFRFWNKAFTHYRTLNLQENLDRLNAEVADAEMREEENMQVLRDMRDLVLYNYTYKASFTVMNFTFNVDYM